MYEEFFGTATGIMPVLRALGAFLLMFLLPGLAWSWVLFRQISLLARLALSIGLSIAIVTLGMLALNVVFGVRISATSTIVYTLGISIVAGAALIFRKYRGRSAKSTPGEEND